MEKILADSFLMLSEIVSDRVSLAREAVLTGFSIVPSQQMLDKITEFAAISGLDKLDNEEVEVENIEEVVEHASGSGSMLSFTLVKTFLSSFSIGSLAVISSSTSMPMGLPPSFAILYSLSVTK